MISENLMRPPLTHAHARVVCALARSVSVSFSSSISSSISFSLRYPIGDHRVPIGGLFFIVPAPASSDASGLYLLFVIVKCLVNIRFHRAEYNSCKRIKFRE